MSRVFKSIARELATEAGVEVCRGYMLERLRLVSPKDLYKAIKDGTHTLGVSEGKDRNFGRKWSKVIEKFSYKGERLQREKLTPSNVLEWLKVDRPDLGSLLLNMGDEGKRWLEEDVKQVFTFLFQETKPKPKATLTLIKRQPPKEELTPEKPLETQPQEVTSIPSAPNTSDTPSISEERRVEQSEEPSQPNKNELEQGAEDAGVHAESQDSAQITTQKAEAETSQTQEQTSEPQQETEPEGEKP